MDAINEKCPNACKSNEEIDKLCTPEFTNQIDKIIFILNNGMSFQKSSILQNIENCIDLDFYIPELINVMIAKIKIEDIIISKQIISSLTRIILKKNIKEQTFKQLEMMCISYYSTYCDQITELILILQQKNQFNFEPFFLFLNEDSVRYEILKIIQVSYLSMNENQQQLALKHIKQCISRRNEKMCRIISQVILKYEKMILLLINDQDWLNNLTLLINDIDTQVRINGAKLFFFSYLKMTELGYESQTKFKLQEFFDLISDDNELIIPIIQCLVEEKQSQQQFIDYIKQQQLNIEFIQNYYNILQRFQYDVVKQYDEYLINSISLLCENSKDFQFLKHLNNVYQLLNEQTHIQILAIYFGNFELNQILFIPYLLDIITNFNKLKNKQIIQQFQRIFDILKKSITNFESKGLWFEVEETIKILNQLSIYLNLKNEFISLLISYLNIGSKAIRQQISLLLFQFLPEYYQIVIPVFVQFINSNNYSYRMLLLDFCIEICKNRSRNFFKHCNLQQVLQLQYDSVFLVRLKIIKLIYEMRMLFWNEEKEIVISLQQALNILMNDKKLVVAQLAKEINQSLGQIHFHHPETIIKQDRLNQQKESKESILNHNKIRINTPTKSNHSGNSSRLFTPGKAQSQTPTMKSQIANIKNKQLLTVKPKQQNGLILPKVPQVNKNNNQQLQQHIFKNPKSNI